MNQKPRRMNQSINEWLNERMNDTPTFPPLLFGMRFHLASLLRVVRRRRRGWRRWGRSGGCVAFDGLRRRRRGGVVEVEGALPLC